MSTLAEPTALAASRGETAKLTVLVGRVHDPVDAGVVTDNLVLRVDKDDLEILVGGVLVHPVAVEHTQVAADTANTLLSNGAKVARGFQLVDSMVLRLSVHDTFAVRALASSTAHGNTVQDKTLLGLVAEAAGLVGAGRAVHARDLGQLAVLPGPDTKEKAEHIALLLLPQLLQVFVSSHVVIRRVCVSLANSACASKDTRVGQGMAGGGWVGGWWEVSMTLACTGTRTYCMCVWRRRAVRAHRYILVPGIMFVCVRVRVCVRA